MAWLIGLAVAALGFIVLGVPLIFGVSWVWGHGGFGGSKLPLWITWIAVIAACFCLAYAVKMIVMAVARRAGGISPKS